MFNMSKPELIPKLTSTNYYQWKGDVVAAMTLKGYDNALLQTVAYSALSPVLYERDPITFYKDLATFIKQEREDSPPPADVYGNYDAHIKYVDETYEAPGVPHYPGRGSPLRSPRAATPYPSEVPHVDEADDEAGPSPRAEDSVGANRAYVIPSEGDTVEAFFQLAKQLRLSPGRRIIAAGVVPNLAEMRPVVP